jgi:hypothetical protein
MNTSRPAKTATDYLVIAVSPALIMVMVHSVCFFLVEVFYRGEAGDGVRWVLFWFILAVVLIARIGIEQGDGQAMLYGLALAAVTWLYLSTIQPSVIFGALLLGIVWFTVHKLTSNCTLIDEDADASGKGLLQSIRRLPRLLKKTPPPVAKPATSPLPAPALVPSPEKKKSTNSQIPGVWLIYFSLAALPIFGLGQTLLPAGDMAARRQGFIYLFCYLAAALGLLVTTSFLGLRRYLRQRRLVMPGNIALGWVQFGAVGVVAVLCLCLLLPRPGAGEAWGSLRYRVDYQLRRASEFAARFNPHGSGSGRAGNQSPPAGQPQNPPSQSGAAPSPDQNQNPGATSSEGHPSPQPSKQGTPQQGGNEGKPLPSLSPLAGAVYPWLRTLFWIAVALGLIWLLYRYRVLILTMLRSAWAAIRNFIALLLGWSKSSSATVPVTPKLVAPPPFKTFKNPFLTGADRVWPPEQLITYSYDALRSWVLEQEARHGSPLTPREFCRRLAGEIPDAADALEHLAFLYGHVAYGASVPANYQPEQLRLVWNYLSLPHPPRSRQPELVSSR